MYFFLLTFRIGTLGNCLPQNSPGPTVISFGRVSGDSVFSIPKHYCLRRFDLFFHPDLRNFKIATVNDNARVSVKKKNDFIESKRKFCPSPSTFIFGFLFFRIWPFRLRRCPWRKQVFRSSPSDFFNLFTSKRVRTTTRRYRTVIRPSEHVRFIE